METTQCISWGVIAIVGIYWLGTIRILINLGASSIFMYLPLFNLLMLGRRAGFGIIFWLIAIASSLGIVYLFPANLFATTWGPVIIGAVFALLFLVRVANFCKKPTYLAYLQLIPIVNLWAIWEMGSIVREKHGHEKVLRRDYEVRVVQWMKESIAQGVGQNKMREQLKDYSLSEAAFLALYKRATEEAEETQK